MEQIVNRFIEAHGGSVYSLPFESHFFNKYGCLRREVDDRARQRRALESLMEEEAKRAAEKQKIRMDIAAFQQFQIRSNDEKQKLAEQENLAEGVKVRVRLVASMIFFRRL